MGDIQDELHARPIQEHAHKRNRVVNGDSDTSSCVQLPVKQGIMLGISASINFDVLCTSLHHTSNLTVDGNIRHIGRIEGRSIFCYYFPLELWIRMSR